MRQIISVLVLSLGLILHNVSAIPANKRLTKQCNDELEISERQIYSKIITPDYDRTMRPRKDQREAVVVSVGMTLELVNDFNGKQNLLTLTATMKIQWTDDFLVWNETYPANCIEKFIMPSSAVWIPDIQMSNSPDGTGRDLFTPSIQSRVECYREGTVNFEPRGVFSVKCEQDVRYFPFDEQVCHVRIASMNYEEEQMKLKFYSQLRNDPPEPIFKIEDEDDDNPMWDIVDHNVIIQNNDGMYFGIKFRRRPLFYYFNIIAPGFIISAVELVIFASDVDNSGKFGVAFTCFLSYTVFLSMSSGDLPKSSDEVSILEKYIYLQMAYIVVIIIGLQALVFLICDFSKVKDSKPPRWLGTFATTVRCMTKRNTSTAKKNKVEPSIAENNSEEGTQVTEVSSDETDKDNAKNDGQQNKSGDDNKEIDGSKQWLAVAEVVNYMSMVLYILAIVITPLVMFIALPQGKPLPTEY